MTKNKIRLLCYECIILLMVDNLPPKNSGLKVLKGIRVALKALVFDFEESQPGKPR